MQERVQEYLQIIWKKLQPLLVIPLCVSLVWLAWQLKQVYIIEPLQPLSKLRSGSITENQQLYSAPIAGTQQITNAQPRQLKVSVTGAVNSPGVYELQDGDLVQTLLQKAGGFNKKADLVYLAKNLNLAEPLASGSQYYIPSLGEEKFLGSTSAKPLISGLAVPSAAKKINLNTGSIAELDTLPGVGAATAQKIIDARPYAQVQDLQNVAGIGDVTFDKLKDLVEI